MSTQMSEDEQPMPDRLYVSTSRRILKWLTSIAAMLGVGAKQLHDTITMSTCTTGAAQIRSSLHSDKDGHKTGFVTTSANWPDTLDMRAELKKQSMFPQLHGSKPWLMLC